MHDSCSVCSLEKTQDRRVFKATHTHTQTCVYIRTYRHMHPCIHTYVTSLYLHRVSVMCLYRLPTVESVFLERAFLRGGTAWPSARARPRRAARTHIRNLGCRIYYERTSYLERGPWQPFTSRSRNCNCILILKLNCHLLSEFKFLIL